MNVQTAMCRSSTCPLRADCYRYRAVPVCAPRVQEYRKFKQQGTSCNGFMTVFEHSAVRTLAEINAGMVKP